MLSLRRQIFSAGSACVDKFFAHALHKPINPKILKFFRAHAECALKNFLRMLSLRMQFFGARSACVGNFLAHTQLAQKTQNGEYLP
jgi:hypothetical protein